MFDLLMMWCSDVILLLFNVVVCEGKRFSIWSFLKVWVLVSNGLMLVMMYGVVGIGCVCMNWCKEIKVVCVLSMLECCVNCWFIILCSVISLLCFSSLVVSLVELVMLVVSMVIDIWMLNMLNCLSNCVWMFVFIGSGLFWCIKWFMFSRVLLSLVCLVLVSLCSVMNLVWCSVCVVSVRSLDIGIIVW